MHPSFGPGDGSIAEFYPHNSPIRAVVPPSTISVSPVIQPAALEARNVAAAAMSAGDPTRPSGTTLLPCSVVYPGISAYLGTSTTPGPIAFTRIRLGASSMASERVKAITAPLVPA
ncbi:hypothetical protein BH23CHL4_BH23CHL4_19270 [soil metagenome]